MSAVSSPQSPPIEAIKQTMKATWMAGDFGVIAKTNAGAGAAFAERLNIPAGARVLDVACGSGNVAIPLAKMGCIVTGVDIATNLVEQARDWAAAEGVTATFDEGDAEALPYADGSFDVVVTMFGAMFAPRPEIVAKELARVLKPGGLLAMASWNPEGFSGKMFKVPSRHLPPGPAGVPAPVLWGDETTVRERLATDFVDVKTKLIAMDFDLPYGASETVAFFRKYFGPTQMAFGRLDEVGQAAFAADLEALWGSSNVASDPEKHMLVRNEYLQVTAIRA